MLSGDLLVEVVHFLKILSYMQVGPHHQHERSAVRGDWRWRLSNAQAGAGSRAGSAPEQVRSRLQGQDHLRPGTAGWRLLLETPSMHSHWP